MTIHGRTAVKGRQTVLVTVAVVARVAIVRSTTAAVFPNLSRAPNSTVALRKPPERLRAGGGRRPGAPEELSSETLAMGRRRGGLRPGGRRRSCVVRGERGPGDHAHARTRTLKEEPPAGHAPQTCRSRRAITLPGTSRGGALGVVRGGRRNGIRKDTRNTEWAESGRQR